MNWELTGGKVESSCEIKGMQAGELFSEQLRRIFLREQEEK